LITAAQFERSFSRMNQRSQSSPDGEAIVLNIKRTAGIDREVLGS
jgi:hypothetical protein